MTWLAFLTIGELLWLREDVAKGRYCSVYYSRGGLERAVDVLLGKE